MLNLKVNKQEKKLVKKDNNQEYQTYQKLSKSK